MCRIQGATEHPAGGKVPAPKRIGSGGREAVGPPQSFTPNPSEPDYSASRRASPAKGHRFGRTYRSNPSTASTTSGPCSAGSTISR